MCYCVQRAWKQGSKTARHNQGVGLLIQTHWRLMALRDRWYEWVMSLGQMSHVTEWMRHIFVNRDTPTNELFKHIGVSWLSEIGDTNEACPSNKWVMYLEQMSHDTDWMRCICMNHVTLTNEPFKHIGVSWLYEIDDANESCPSNEWDTSHIFMNHFPITNESCHAYDWVLSHLRMSHSNTLASYDRRNNWVMSMV